VIKTEDVEVRQIKTGCLAQYCYVIESQGELAIIDPLRDISAYLTIIEESKSKLKWAILTHFHADFVAGHVQLSKQTGSTIVFGPDSKPEFDCKIVKNEERLPIGNHYLRALHTPGHTFESTSYILETPTGKQLCVFTGDTLFLGDVGRPDLAQKGEFTEKDLARLMFKSLKLLKQLPDDCVVLPAHGAGSACGKNIQPGNHCTIGNQKKTNPTFAEEDEEKFVEKATSNLPAPPNYFGLDVALNKSANLETVETIVERSFQPLSPEKVKELSADESVFLLDCRPAVEFIAGHIPKSVWVSLDTTYAIWAAYVLDPRKGEKAILITPPGREKEAVTRLTRTGIDSVIGYLEDGIASWKNVGFQLAESIVIDYDTHEEFKQKVDGAQIIDVRNIGEWQDGVLEDSTLLTLSKVKDGTLSSSDKNKRLVMQCRTGVRSLLATSLAIRHGWTDVANLAGGIVQLKEKNVPISLMNRDPVHSL